MLHVNQLFPFCTDRGVLQQLTTNHISCIDILGKQSGRVVDKRKALLEVEISMSSQQLHSSSLGMELLDGCSLYLSIRKERDTAVIDVGDHSCFVCKIEAISTSSFQQTDDINPTNHPLTTKCLRDIGIIS